VWVILLPTITRCQRCDYAVSKHQLLRLQSHVLQPSTAHRGACVDALKKYGCCALHKQLPNAPCNSAAYPCRLSPRCSLHPPYEWCLHQRRKHASTVHQGSSMPLPLALHPLLPLSPTTRQAEHRAVWRPGSRALAECSSSPKLTGYRRGAFVMSPKNCIMLAGCGVWGACKIALPH
jgi:hypothetical protein